MFDFDEKPELNITPLVDVMLVLMAILMLTAPIMVYEESITLPKGSRSKSVDDNAKIEIKIDKDGNIMIKEKKYSMNNFADNFILFSEQFDKNTPVFIKADKNLLYDNVIFILKSVKESGFFKVSLITDG
ncbi:MAG: biopolymer transporter ExbD [Campylobacterales bacterium]|nr:biopolymer transporter ExbD [Campylobacterales bacterium]